MKYKNRFVVLLIYLCSSVFICGFNGV